MCCCCRRNRAPTPDLIAPPKQVSPASPIINAPNTNNTNNTIIPTTPNSPPPSYSMTSSPNSFALPRFVLRTQVGGMGSFGNGSSSFVAEMGIGNDGRTRSHNENDEFSNKEVIKMEEKERRAAKKLEAKAEKHREQQEKDAERVRDPNKTLRSGAISTQW